MLVLTRYRGQKIKLTVEGRTITLTLIDVKGGCVRLGFDAPEDVVILREELIDNSKEVSASAVPATVREQTTGRKRVS